MIKYTRLLIIIAVCVFVIASEALFFNRTFIEEITLFFFHKGILKTTYYTLAYLSSAVFLALIFFIRSRYAFLLVFSLFLLAYIITASYIFINGYGFGLKELQTMLHESGKFSFDVWNTYGTYIASSLIIGAGIVALAFVLRKVIAKQNLHAPNKWVIASGVASFILTFSVTYKTVNTNNKFPVFSNMMNTFIYLASNSTYYGERDVVSSQPSQVASYNNIIWMIDESIGGSYLSINGYEKDSTPYLSSIQDKFVNLGLASSAANCSAESNISLMSGIQLNQLPDRDNLALKNPSIFQYAKKAGYKTHYISGQSKDDLLQNYMTPFDLAHIDTFYQPKPDYNDDQIPEQDIIEKTVAALKSSEKNFIFIVKRGAHFHWEGQYPKQKTVFTPTLATSDNLIPANKEKALNSYINTVRYRTDDFFNEFFKQSQLLNDQNTLTIYTSDHGQSILEGTSHGTHCDSTEPNLSQGIVPLLIFTNKDKERFSKLAKNRYSHFQLFPTTVQLMGYQDYSNGYTFFNKPDNDQRFFSGDIFGRTVTNFSNIAPNRSVQQAALEAK